MEQQEKLKKVLFVNKFGPVSNAITGQTAKELADYLHANGCEVRFLCIGAIYRATKKDPEWQVAYPIKFIRDFYSGDSSAIRFVMSFIDGFRLFVHALRMKSDAIIVMTEPPLLFFWFQLFRSFIKRKLFYWTMDIYPDAFAAGKFISRANIFYRFFASVVYKKAPDLLIALGEEQRKYLEEKFGSSVPYVVIPCGIVERNGYPTHAATVSGKIVFGYAGNIGAAHDPDFLTELVKQLDPARHEMVLSIYGTKASQVKEAIGNNECIKYREFLNHDDISAIDINVASLLKEWNHISVPSKAVTAICCGSTLLLNVPGSADAWQMFGQSAWIVEPGSDYEDGIRRFLQEDLSEAQILQKRMHARELAGDWVEKKTEAYKKVLTTIQQS